MLQLNAPRISGHLRIEDVVKTARRQGASTSITAITNRLRNPGYATLLGAARYIGHGKNPSWLVSKDGARRIIACAKVGTWNFMRDTRDLTVDKVESLAKSIEEATRSGAYLTAARAARELKISLSTLYMMENVPWETFGGQRFLKGDAVKNLRIAISRKRLKRSRRKRK